MGQDAIVHAMPAAAFERAPLENIQHNCPLCHETLGWVEFQAHAPACIAAHPDEVAELEAKEE